MSCVQSWLERQQSSVLAFLAAPTLNSTSDSVLSSQVSASRMNTENIMAFKGNAGTLATIQTQSLFPTAIKHFSSFQAAFDDVLRP